MERASRAGRRCDFQCCGPALNNNEAGMRSAIGFYLDIFY